MFELFGCLMADGHFLGEGAFVGRFEEGCAAYFAEVDADRIVDGDAFHAEDTVNKALELFGVFDFYDFDFDRGIGQFYRIGLFLLDVFGHFHLDFEHD